MKPSKQTMRERALQVVKRVEADERFHYPQADVFINAPLALIQVDLAARRQTAMEILADEA